MAKVLLLF